MFLGRCSKANIMKIRYNERNCTAKSLFMNFQYIDVGTTSREIQNILGHCIVFPMKQKWYLF